MISFEEQLQLTKSAKQLSEYLSVTIISKDEILLFSVGTKYRYPPEEWIIEFKDCIKDLNLNALILGKAYVDSVLSMDYTSMIRLRDKLNILIAQEEKGRVEV